MAEYLVFNSPELADLDPIWMQQSHQTLSPHFLRSLVIKAYDFITTEPGPNLQKRIELAPLWLGWWVEYLMKFSDNSEDISQSNKIISFDEVRELSQEYKAQDRSFGIAFMATGEMTPGQREFMRKTSELAGNCAVGLEGEQYFERHLQRRHPCLPEVMRKSMIVALGYYVFTIPSLPPGENENDFYDRIYKQLQTSFYFYTVGDPNASKKKLRYGATEITEFPHPHASIFTETLLPDTEATGPILLDGLEARRELLYSLS